MAPLVPAFEEGRLGIVQAVGSDNTSGSHFEAQDQMEHGESQSSRAGGGWIGRYLRARSPERAKPLSAVAIGTTVPESLRGASSAAVIESVADLRFSGAEGAAPAAVAAIGALYGAERGPLGRAGAEALALLSRVEALQASRYAPENGADYGTDRFGAGLREIARLVKAEVGLEVACVDLDGWDTHFVQGGKDGLQASLISRLATGLAAFDADLAAHRERVTTVVMTEFGRRTYENSSGGTDHGRGFAMFALGGHVAGGRVHGTWPGLDVEEGPIGPGGLRVLLDYRSVLAEVLSNAAGLRDVSAVFPDFTPRPVGVVPPRAPASDLSRMGA
jgi:uncharacterized protein (DUF1501 family)